MMFTVCNVPKFLEEQMNKMKDTITSDMNEDNLKGYEYAVETMLSIIRFIRLPKRMWSDMHIQE